MRGGRRNFILRGWVGGAVGARPPVSTFFRKTAAISGFEVKKHAVFNC